MVADNRLNTDVPGISWPPVSPRCETAPSADRHAVKSSLLSRFTEYVFVGKYQCSHKADYKTEQTTNGRWPHPKPHKYTYGHTCYVIFCMYAYLSETISFT